MTTKLHKAYSKNKNAFYYYQCECTNVFIARNDKTPKSCGCLQGKPKSVNIETNINNVEIIPKTHKKCYMCKELLSLDSFHKGCSKCKECTKIYNKQWQEENRDKSREYNYKHRLKELGLSKEEHIKTKEDRQIIANENKQKIINRQLTRKQLEIQRELLTQLPTKQCIKCNEIKPKSEFYRTKDKFDGYDNRCKECEKLRLRQERGYEPKRIVTEEEKRITRSLNKHKRRVREKNAGPVPKAKDILELKRKQKNRCYWCYADISKRYDKDHYMPICKGGDSSLENFVLTCPSCNLSKNGLDPIVYANKNGRLL